MGILEYEAVLLFIVIILDILIGSINHIFTKKDNVSSLAQQSLAEKTVTVVAVLAMILVLHLNDFGLFNAPAIEPLKATTSALFGTIILALLYYELTSVLKHIQTVTGIDLSIIPGVKSELEHMQDKINKGEK